MPFETAGRWIGVAIGWQSRTGGLVVPCEDSLVRQVRDAGIDDATKCRLIPVTGPEHLGHVGSKVGLARALAGAGVSAPRFTVVESAAGLVDACDTLGYPLMVKVDESGGGQGVFECHSTAEARALSMRCLPLPLLVQEWIDGELLDLSGFFRAGRPVHFVHAQFISTVGGRFGPSKVRRYTPLANLDWHLCDSLSALSAALGLDGFANISALRRRDGRLSFIEADLRPNVWVEATRLFGDDPAPAIRAAFAQGRCRARPRRRVSPRTVDLPYPFRLRAWEVLCNRHGVWRTLGEHDPLDLLRHVSGRPGRLLTRMASRIAGFAQPSKAAPSPSDGGR